MKRSVAALLMLALTLIPVLAGCSSLPEVAPSLPSTDLSPLAVEDSPLPTPTDASAAGGASTEPSAPAAAEAVTPTPDPDLASITGTIAMEGHPTGTLPATLYLGDPTGANPIGAYVSLDIASAVQGYVAADGSFMFPNVQPGTYSIVVWTPIKAYIVPDPETEVARLIEVRDNARIDVGHIEVPAMGD